MDKAATGIKVACYFPYCKAKQALLRSMRTCRSDVKGEVQVGTPRGESTDAEHSGGPRIVVMKLL